MHLPILDFRPYKIGVNIQAERTIPEDAPQDEYRYSFIYEKEGIRPEFIGIVNYGVIGLIQLALGFSDKADLSESEALALYDQYMTQTKELMYAKNHDYDEAWRLMRISSYTDLILMKLFRTKQIESHHGQTLVSEGIDANYMDMINYALFGLIKLEFGEA